MAQRVCGDPTSATVVSEYHRQGYIPDSRSHGAIVMSESRNHSR